jgi:hypothetical protein
MAIKTEEKKIIFSRIQRKRSCIKDPPLKFEKKERN